MKSKYADRKKIYYIDFIEYYVDNKLIINQFREIKKITFKVYLHITTIITLYQRCPNCGSRTACDSLKDYLWLSINESEIHFHFCTIKF